MNQSFVEITYLITGLVLPVFYVPQILRILRDTGKLSSYSLSKAVFQFFLRIPALVFAVVVVHSGFMISVLLMDLFGRLGEVVASVYSLRKQGVGMGAVLSRMQPSFLQRDLPDGQHSSGFMPLAAEKYSRF